MACYRLKFSFTICTSLQTGSPVIEGLSPNEGKGYSIHGCMKTLSATEGLTEAASQRVQREAELPHQLSFTGCLVRCLIGMQCYKILKILNINYYKYKY
jgi:hypothetical protein